MQATDIQLAPIWSKIDDVTDDFNYISLFYRGKVEQDLELLFTAIEDLEGSLNLLKISIKDATRETEG